MPRFHFQRLVVYRRALEFVVYVHSLLPQLTCARADLRDQLVRAATSITLNVAEGSGELSKPEKMRFYRIARRSAMECAAVLDLLEATGATPTTHLEPGRALLDEVVAMLTTMTRRKEG